MRVKSHARRWKRCKSNPRLSDLAPARHRGCLSDPGRDLRFVEFVVLVDVEVTHVLVLGFSGWERTQRRAAEESHLHVLGEAMKVEEPAPILDAIEGRVPPHILANVGYVAHDQRVEAASDMVFPSWHGCDVSLHGNIVVRLRDLRVAPCE